MSQTIWMNGELVPYEDAKVHVLTHALHYGTSVFEGVRAYETPDGGTGVFRHTDHIDRLFRSAALYHMDVPFSKDAIQQCVMIVLQAASRIGLNARLQPRYHSRFAAAITAH